MCNPGLVKNKNERRKAHIRDYPGYLGYGDLFKGEFIIGIHADWPIYPCESGNGHALFDLAQFPKSTRFILHDDIDRCVLFRAYGYGERRPNPEDRLPIAAWHEDLCRLAEDRLVSGVRRGTHRQWEVAKRIRIRQGIIARAARDGVEISGDPLRRIVSSTGDGQWAPIELPALPPKDEYDLYAPDWPLIREPSGVQITPLGWARWKVLWGMR
jgi:hypothetical protein